MSEYVKLPAAWNNIPEDRIFKMSAVEFFFLIFNHSTVFYKLLVHLFSGIFIIVYDYSLIWVQNI